MTKSPLWQNKEFIRIYNKLVQDKKRHPERYIYNKSSMKSLALSEYNLILMEREANKDKTQNEIDKQRQEYEAQRRRESPLEFGETPYIPDGMTPSIKIIDGFTIIDYSDLKRKKPESNIWNF